MILQMSVHSVQSSIEMPTKKINQFWLRLSSIYISHPSQLLIIVFKLSMSKMLYFLYTMFLHDDNLITRNIAGTVAERIATKYWQYVIIIIVLCVHIIFRKINYYVVVYQITNSAKRRYAHYNCFRTKLEVIIIEVRYIRHHSIT